MLVAEPTGGVIWHACRGAITLRVQVAGREHVGYVARGRQRLRAHDPHRRAAHQPRVISKRTAYPTDDAARGSMLVVGGAAGAGAGFNVVPGSAWFSVDRRFNPEEDLDDQVTRLTCVDQGGGGGAPAPTSTSRSCRSSRPAAPTRAPRAAEALARCVEAVEGAAAALPAVPGGARHALVRPARHPGLRLRRRPTRGRPRPNEFIDEEAMRRCAAVYALFAAESSE